MNHESVPASIHEIATSFTADAVVSIMQITDGSINETYKVETVSGSFILQKMNHIFSPVVMGNLALIQPYVTAVDVTVPRGVTTVTGDPYLVGEGEWYRALNYIPGLTIHDHVSELQATSAAILLARFHSALAPCQSELAVAIPHFHDTAHYMQRLKAVMWANEDELKTDTLEPLATRILSLYKETYIDLSHLPQRIIHGDMKISNVRFNKEGDAIALIDMDTLMRANVAIEVGEAIASWAGTAGEDDPVQFFDETIAQAALSSYTASVTAVSSEELSNIPYCIGLMTLELAARFITDAYEEQYFALSTKYDSLYEQNKTRGENQLRFYETFREKSHLLEE